MKGMVFMPKILFLAQFAPTDGIVLNQPKNQEEVFYAETYHWKIIEALNSLNYDFDSASDVKYFLDNYNKYDLVWSVYNRLGFRNSEIFIQSLCEYLGVKYIGATPNVRALIEDKSLSKQLAQHVGINTADWVVGSRQYPLSQIPPFSGSYFVKPRFGSASINIDESCICDTWNDVIKKSEVYFQKNIDVIVEKFIDGLCYGVSILNTKSKKLLIAPPHYTISNKAGNVMTYSQKRFVDAGMNRYICHDDSINKQLTYMAEKYFLEMQPCDYARIDFIVDSNSMIPYFLEVNALMNLGIHGGFINSFLNSYFNSYEEIIRHIVELGLSKVEKTSSTSNP